MITPSGAIFQPGAIGSLAIKNRIVLPPMLMGYGSEDGYVTERAKDYYAARARGGVGLVIVEASMPLPGGKMFQYYIDSSDDRYLPGLTELATAIKVNGARAAIQLGDGGREVRRDLTGRAPMGPSPIAARKRETPIEMTLFDIRNAVRLFAEATLRAKRAGFEGVEMHAAHVYLLSQFLSGFTNHRNDEYGGSVENRFRIMVDIINAARELVGDSFPIWFRINGIEYDTPSGVTLDDARAFARLGEEAGYDAVSISAGSPHYEATMHTLYTPPKFLVPLAAAIKRDVRFPVMVTGRLTAALGQEILEAGEADFICIGRGLMADPDLPNKVEAGKSEDVRPCPCLLDCVNRGVLRDTPIVCMSNAALGREREYELHPATQSEQVVVIGGGVAGLETALVAAQRGHDVTLLEATSDIGGQMRTASYAPCKGDLRNLLEFYSRQLEKAGAKVLTATVATTESILAMQPEVVVIATGADVCVQPSVTQSVGVVDAMLQQPTPSGRTVAIIGGDTRSCELADLLTEGVQNEVTVASTLPKIAPELTGIVRGTLLQRLRDKGVKQLMRVQIGAITRDSIEFTGDALGAREQPADLVVLNSKASVAPELLDALRRSVPRVFVVGDALEKREHIDAIADGARVGRLI